LEAVLNIAKVTIKSSSVEDILMVIPENYRIDEMPCVGFGIFNVEGKMVGSCKVTDEENHTLSVYAYKSTQTAKRAFMSAFELHNSTDEVECTFIEVK
jgi:hypothetical protein